MLLDDVMNANATFENVFARHPNVVFNASSDPLIVGEQVSAQLGAPICILPCEGSSFRCETWHLELPDLRITHVAVTPCYAKGGPSKLPVLVFPISGEVNGARGHRKIGVKASQHGLMLPAGSCIEGTWITNAKMLFIEINPYRLEQVAHSMTKSRVDVALHSPERPIRFHEISQPLLQYGRHDFNVIFHHLTDALLKFGQVPNFLLNSGIDDCFYRAITLLLLPNLVIDGAGSVGSKVPANLERLCEYIMANLSAEIRMADLQKVVGLSARSIQNMFRRHVKMTPKQWVLEQKLIAVRSEILMTRGQRTVTEIAVPYFNNLGDFARRYQSRFGELPSETMTRASLGEFVY